MNRGFHEVMKMKTIKYYCDRCGKEIPYTVHDFDDKNIVTWHFGKLNFLDNNMYLNSEYEICEKCAGVLNLEFETERLKLLHQFGVK